MKYKKILNLNLKDSILAYFSSFKQTENNETLISLKLEAFFDSKELLENFKGNSIFIILIIKF
jgi:hypothetical protein